MAAAYRFLHFTITSPQNLVLNYTQTCPDIAWSELHWRIEPWQHRRVLSQGRKHWDARKIGWCLAWTMDDNGLSWRLCFNLYELNYYSQMWDNWDNISTYKTTAAERNWLKLPAKTEVWPCCWNSIRLPIFKWCISVLRCKWSICTQSKSNTFLHIHHIHPYSLYIGSTLGDQQFQFEKLGLPSAPPAAPWALQRQCWGNRSLMSVAVGAAWSPWNVQPRHPGNTTEPMSPSRWRRWLVWVGQVRIPKLLDWWGEGQIEAKIAKIGRQKLNKTSSTTRQSQQKGARDSWSHFRKQN